MYFIFIYFHFFLMILEKFWSSQFISGLSISYDVTECLVKLHDYWASDIAFSLTLLSQFLEDMEAYAEVSKEKSAGVWKHSLTGPLVADLIFLTVGLGHHVILYIPC